MLQNPNQGSNAGWCGRHKIGANNIKDKKIYWITGVTRFLVINAVKQQEAFLKQ